MREAIVVSDISKQFHRYHSHRPTTFKEAALYGWQRMRPIESFWALRDVTFSIARGRMAGVVGRNGAGKSTLLRLIGGVGRPTKGNVKAEGQVGALMDLDAGFHPDLTGRENVFVSGIIAGLTRRELKQQFDSIVAFAELESFIDSPVRTYSTGMRMRLAFAVAVHTRPDVLLIDEVLAVGDLSFQKKCLEQIAAFKNQGCTIMLVSHDLTMISRLCDEVLWLRCGQLAAHGTAEVVVGQYVDEFTMETHRRTPPTHPVVVTAAGTELRVNENRLGSLEMRIVSVRLVGASGCSANSLQAGDSLRVESSTTPLAVC